MEERQNLKISVFQLPMSNLGKVHCWEKGSYGIRYSVSNSHDGLLIN